jgi:hypothetical protein
MSNKIFLYYLFVVVFFSLILFFIHDFLLFSDIIILKLWKIYSFHLSVSLIIFTSLFLISKIDFDKVGFAFMTLSVLKMLGAILFLLPVILDVNFDKIPDIINFFIPYFIFLILEIFFSLKLLHLSNK